MQKPPSCSIYVTDHHWGPTCTSDVYRNAKYAVATIEQT